MLIVKQVFKETISWKEGAIQVVVISLITIGVWNAGKYGKMADTEIWNGEITSKKRVHDYYETSYEICTGSGKNQTCTTHYEDHYTVKWYAYTTAGGNILFDSYDDSWESTRNNRPNPARYLSAKVGEPVAIVHSYDNYIQAVPEAIFNQTVAVEEEFKDLIPNQPIVYDFYRIDRVMPVGVKMPPTDVKKINYTLNMGLRKLGPKKQVNINLVIVNTDDPNYRYSLEFAWKSGEKNDATIIIGSTDYPKIDFVEVMTFGKNKGNELFKEYLSDELFTLEEIDTEKVPAIILNKISKHFDRINMAEFEEYESAIEPATWVKWLAWLLSIGLSIGLTYFFHRHDTFGNEMRGWRHGNFHRY